MARTGQLVLPIRDISLVSLGSPISEVIFPANTRGILVGNAGVLNITINDIAQVNVPFVAGITPGFFQSVQAGGSASNIWAVL